MNSKVSALAVGLMVTVLAAVAGLLMWQRGG